MDDSEYARVEPAVLIIEDKPPKPVPDDCPLCKYKTGIVAFQNSWDDPVVQRCLNCNWRFEKPGAKRPEKKPERDAGPAYA
jgi:hypothetical protein